MASPVRAIVFALLLGVAQAAASAPSRLAVLPIVLEGPHGSATISSIFNDVAAATDMRANLRVVSYEEMFAASEEGLGDRVRDCGSNTNCVSSRLRAFNARLGLVVVLDFSSKPPILSLQLLDTDDSKMIASAVGEVGGGSLSETIRARTREVLEQGGYSRAGRVLIEVSPPNARVSIPGIEPDPGMPNRFTVAPGTYRVSAALDGYAPTNGEVTVTSGGEAQLKLELTAETSLIESPWLWVAVGVVIAGSVTAVAVATYNPDRYLCLQLGTANSACPE